MNLTIISGRRYPKCEQIGESAAVPKNLNKLIADLLAENPSMAWDEALYRLSAATGKARS